MRIVVIITMFLLAGVMHLANNERDKLMKERSEIKAELDAVSEQLRETEKLCKPPVKLPENIKLSDEDTVIDPDGETLPAPGTVGIYKNRKCLVIKDSPEKLHCVLCVGDKLDKVYRDPEDGPDPFSTNKVLNIHITDVKDTWVKYKVYDGPNNLKGDTRTMHGSTICRHFGKKL